MPVHCRRTFTHSITAYNTRQHVATNLRRLSKQKRTYVYIRRLYFRSSYYPNRLRRQKSRANEIIISSYRNVPHYFFEMSKTRSQTLLVHLSMQKCTVTVGVDNRIENCQITDLKKSKENAIEESCECVRRDDVAQMLGNDRYRFFLHVCAWHCWHYPKLFTRDSQLLKGVDERNTPSIRFPT